MLGKSSVTLSLAKGAINGGSDANIYSGLDLEGQCFAPCFATEDRKEEMPALPEKRKPESKGNRKLSPTVSVTSQQNYRRGGLL